MRTRAWLWLLLVPVVIGLWRLQFDVEILNLLPSDSPVVRGLKLYQRNFSNARELILTVRGSTPEITESSARAIAGALRKESNLVAQATWQPPWLESPVQSAELVAFLWMNLPPAEFAELTNRLAEPNVPRLLADAREQLATSFSPGDLAIRGYDPFNLMQLPEAVRAGSPAMVSGQEMFASDDGKFRVVFVESKADLASYRDCLNWLRAVQHSVEAARDADQFPPGVEIGYTGRPAFVSEIAGGMERDMFASVLGTMVIIAALFWWTHRRWKPLFWLLALLAIILSGTMALGGLLIGSLNVVSLGFAAILLGLAVDYGLILYQEAKGRGADSVQAIRREAGAGIVWSALTTSGAFLLLNLSGLPGLAQLGSLVAIGVLLAAAVMLVAYLPPLLNGPATNPTSPTNRAGSAAKDSVIVSGVRIVPSSRPAVGRRVGWVLTALVLGGGGLAFALRGPVFDHSTDALRPRDSAAYAALDAIKAALSRVQEPAWMLITGNTEAEVAARLAAARGILEDAVKAGTVERFTVPTMLWPNPEHQSANRPALSTLVRRLDALTQAALDHGFNTQSMALTERLFATWQQASAHSDVYWPTNPASRWVIEKVTARQSAAQGFIPNTGRGGGPRTDRPDTGDPESAEFLALVLVYPKATADVDSASLGLSIPADERNILLSGWQLLGTDMFELVERDLSRVLLPMAGLLLVSLWLAFRRFNEVLLSLGTLVTSALGLAAVMALAGWSWNLMNLMALPLLLGAGVDYSIHMQLALRRHAGDAAAVWRTVGRALALCAGTTVTGFGSLSFSSNAGMASLGQVCCAGIACSFVTSTLLLPAWWQFLNPTGRTRTVAS